MAGIDLRLIKRALDDINKMIGQMGPLHINSGIFGREDYEIEELDPACDILVIGKANKKITMSNIMDLIEQMQNQFEILDKYFGYSYFYEGIKYDKKNKYLLCPVGIIKTQLNANLFAFAIAK